MPSRQGRPTISQVARLAKVSVSTVSAVLNGTVRVSPETAARVKNAMQVLDYRPDEMGRSLRTGRTRVIGVVVPDITNPFYPEILRKIDLAAQDKGYSVILCDSGDDPEREKRHLEVLFYGRRIDGALVAATDSTSSYEWLAAKGFPVVFFERIPFAGTFTAVSTDHAGAARLAARHFIALGHRRIAFMATRMSLSSNSARLEGFRQAMQEAEIAVHANYLRTGLKGVEDGREVGRQPPKAHPAPTAILCSNSSLLLGLVRAVGELGLNCPADISLIGFDHTIWTEHFNPPLTTLAQPIDVIAREAMSLLLSRIDSWETPKAGANVLYLHDELCVRGSTAVPPADAKVRRQVG